MDEKTLKVFQTLWQMQRGHPPRSKAYEVIHCAYCAVNVTGDLKKVLEFLKRDLELKNPQIDALVEQAKKQGKDPDKVKMPKAYLITREAISTLQKTIQEAA